MSASNLNKEVSLFLDNLNHPFRNEIEELRKIVLAANTRLEENIKWNGPNYHIGEEDRITMKIQPPKLIQLIFHCGAKSKVQPKTKLIEDDSGLLEWKKNDRALVSFRTLAEIENSKPALIAVIKEWTKATI